MITTVCTMTAFEYELKDFERIDHLIKNEYQENDVLHLKCWNKREADILRNYVKKYYPEVIVKVSYYEWGGEE